MSLTESVYHDVWDSDCSVWVLIWSPMNTIIDNSVRVSTRFEIREVVWDPTDNSVYDSVYTAVSKYMRDYVP